MLNPIKLPHQVVVNRDTGFFLIAIRIQGVLLVKTYIYIYIIYMYGFWAIELPPLFLNERKPRESCDPMVSFGIGQIGSLCRF